MSPGNPGLMTNAGSLFKYLPQEGGRVGGGGVVRRKIFLSAERCYYHSQKRKADEYRLPVSVIVYSYSSLLADADL